MTLIQRLRDALDVGASVPAGLLGGDASHPAWAAVVSWVPAAVLVAIVDRPDPGVILTLRTDTVRNHAGQIAFPGGRIDAEDEGPVAAALREASEEIGLATDRVKVLGTADRYQTITGFDVTPVLGLVPPDLQLVPQPEEVAEIFEVPLAHLLEPAHHIVRNILWQGHERHYYEIHWEGHRIWGATAAMIVNLSRRLTANG